MDNGASSYRRFLDGDDNGFVEIVRGYKDGLILFLDSFVRNLSIAEELAEGTFVKLGNIKHILKQCSRKQIRFFQRIILNVSEFLTRQIA